MTDEKLTVDQRWNQVLNELPAIGKNSRNQQQGFNYRSIDSVLDKVKPLLGKHGIHVIPVAQVCDRTARTTAKGNQLNVCYMTVEWQIRSVDGDFFTAETCGEGTDSGDKATSKAQTMAFKYLLWPSLAIAENDETDADAYSVDASVPAQKSTTTKRAAPKVAAPPTTATTTAESGALRSLFAIKDRAGEAVVPKDDDARHAWAAKILARPVTSFTELRDEDISILKKTAREQAINSQLPGTPDEDPQRPF